MRFAGVDVGLQDFLLDFAPGFGVVFVGVVADAPEHAPGLGLKGGPVVPVHDGDVSAECVEGFGVCADHVAPHDGVGSFGAYELCGFFVIVGEHVAGAFGCVSGFASLAAGVEFDFVSADVEVAEVGVECEDLVGHFFEEWQCVGM